MSGLGQILFGLILLLVSVGAIMVLRPRPGASANAVVKKLGPLLASLITVGFGVGIILLAAYFTTIDNIKLSG